MAVEEWGPLRRRTDVRLALFVGVTCLVLVIVGVATLLLMRDISAVAFGLFGLGYSWSVLWPLRDRWRAWRAIGDVSLEMADLNLVPGDVSVCGVRIVARREVVLHEVVLLFEYRDSRGGSGPTAWQVDVAVSDPRLPAGEVVQLTADVVLPPGVPPSYFDSSATRQWTVTGTVTLTDGTHWQRAYPVMVYPTP